MRVQGVQERAENTDPVLRVSGEEILLPTLTTSHLPVRKSRIQLHREFFRPRARSLTTSLEGTMVLNAEL